MPFLLHRLLMIITFMYVGASHTSHPAQLGPDFHNEIRLTDKADKLQ